MKAPDALTTYLSQEISASDLSQLLDEHLHTMIRLYAASGEPISEEQASTYHHIRRLRDLIGAMEVEQVEAIAS
jgi:hypothetical protein